MKRFLKSIAPLAALVIFSLASWALYQELRHYHWREFRASLREIPSGRVALAMLLVGLDYTILVCNDWVASRIVGRRVPLARLAVGSFTGYVASHNLGAAFGGTPVRYRFYSSWGVPPAGIAIWIFMLTWSFALGASLAGGASCLARPLTAPESFPLPLGNVRWLGAVLLVLPTIYVASCGVFRSPLHVRGRTVKLPPPRLAALQVIVGSADLCCAAGILYVLLPPRRRSVTPHL